MNGTVEGLVETNGQFWCMTAFVAWIVIKFLIHAEWMIFTNKKGSVFAVEMHDGYSLKTVWAYWDDEGLRYD